MSSYYVSLSRYWPKGRPNKFVGEFSKEEAQKEIERVRRFGTLELIEDETEIPVNLEKAVQVSIMPKIAARRIGLKSPIFGDKKNTLIGHQIPTNIDEIDPIIIDKLKENHNGKKIHDTTITKKNKVAKVEETLKAEEKVALALVESKEQQIVATVEATNDIDTEKSTNIKEDEDKMLGNIKEFDTANAVAGLRKYYRELAEKKDPELEVLEETDGEVKITESISTTISIPAKPKTNVDLKYVAVTWFKGEIEWLKLQGINAEEIERVYSPDQLEGKIVIGFVPDHLLYRAAEIWHIYKPRMKPTQRGKDLTAQELIEAGARFDKYIPARKIEND